MLKKIGKGTGIGFLFILALSILVIVIAFIRQSVIDNAINDDISLILKNQEYQEAVSVNNVNVITQHVSCGYAVLQMFGNWCGTEVTEDSLYNEYGKVVTSTGGSFCNEMNKQFPKYKTTMYKNCKNTELLAKIYNSLKQGIPVPFEFAAVYKDGGNDVWTLHYAIVTGMDIPNDKITVANPYGYAETYKTDDFLKATRFESFKDMPFYFKIAFALGIFEKNTVFVPIEQ